MARSDSLSALDEADDKQAKLVEQRNLKAALDKKSRQRKEREKRSRQQNTSSSNTLVSPEGKERISLEEQDKENMTGTRGTRKITAKELEQLQRDKNDLEFEKDAWSKEKRTLEKNVERLQKGYEEAMAEKEAYEKDTGSMAQEVKDYRDENENLKEHLNVALKALKDAGKHARFEESKGTNTAIREFIKGQGYREWKFIKTDQKKAIFVDYIYDHIAETTGMADSSSDFHLSRSEFHRIYTGSCIKKLGDRRQLSQTMMLKAVISFCKRYEYIPTPDQIKDVWNLPAEGSAEYEAALSLFIWYVDSLLPAMVGFDQFGPNIRRYKFLVTHVMIDGKKKPQVTIKSEAFGWVTYENCYEKWTHVVPKKVEDFEWAAPKYNKDDAATHMWHKTKWSDSRNGQVPGGGWAPGAYTALNKNVEDILKFRGDDHKNDTKWKMVKFAYTQIRQKYDITDKYHSKKRKRKTIKPVELEYDEIIELEEDDDFSVGSDMSRGNL